MIPMTAETPADFAVSECAYACAWCNAVNDSMTAEWCSCLSSRNTLVCATCDRCFCDAAPFWRSAFTKSVAGTMFLQREQKRKGFKPVANARQETMQRPLILVIDDDKVVHMIAERVLRVFGGTIVHAEDGETGLAMAQQLRPELVITDALLPKLDGRELSRILKSDPETQNCKLVVMTGLYKGRRYRDEAFRNFHVDDYIEKPVAAPALRALAGKLLGVPEEIAS